MAYNVTNIEEKRSFYRIFTGVCLLISCVAATVALSRSDFIHYLKLHATTAGRNRHRILSKRSTSFLTGVTVEDVLNRAVDDDMVAVDINDITGTGSSSNIDTTSTVTTTTSTTTSATTSSTTSTSGSTAATSATTSVVTSSSSANSHRRTSTRSSRSTKRRRIHDTHSR